ncbi:MAG TPA: hypothetical protein VLS89_02830, partial [Candidatus Nanopelagicales bacterium]|nr:hypothetical protein [Candidatus Nanopelagicales bacterium]
MYRPNAIRCVQFSRDAFVREVLDGSGAPFGGPISQQTRYLAGYLEKDLGVKSLLIEEHYIDRHFIEEFSAYYSRCLATVPNSCRRIHAFNIPLDDATLDDMLSRAASGELEVVQRQIRAAYCGFIVLRPLATAPIGRTVLRYPEDRAERKYLPTLSYTVHLLGFDFEVRGIAFQQQDVAVAACATTAIWTALQRVVRNEGGRPPTPSAVTHAAMQYDTHDGRPLPGRGGLKISQLCNALRFFNFAPELVTVGNDPGMFLRYLGVYIRSGIPIILCLDGTRGGSGHTVTVVGYRESSSGAPTRKIPLVVADPDGLGAEHLDKKHVAVALRNQSYD